MPLQSLCLFNNICGGQLVHANRLVCAYEKYDVIFSNHTFFVVILHFNLISNYPGDLQTPVWIIQCVFFSTVHRSVPHSAGRWRSFLYVLVYNSLHAEEEKDGVEDEEVPVTSHESDS